MKDRSRMPTLLFRVVLSVLMVGCIIAIPNGARCADNIRALHLVLRAITVDDVKRIVDLSSSNGFNMVIISIADAVRLKSMPWVKGSSTWSVQQFIDIVTYAHHKKLAVVPEVKLLSHQEIFFGNVSPSLMYNDLTYDPRNDEVYAKVFPVLDEIVELIHPKAIHIGHDEISGWQFKNKIGRVGLVQLRKDEQAMPADLFLKDVRRVHAHLKKRNIQTWIWGDMLLSPEEFPQMLDKHLHGTLPGYGKSLRQKLPRDVVICDWHYFDRQPDFPSLREFRQEGYRVLGATWKTTETIRNFSSYAATNGASGMIATTWFHVQRKEWDVVERIIRESGAIFLKDFPDAK